MPDRERYLVLGSAGWVGHYLVPTLARRRPEAEVLAAYRKRKPTFFLDGLPNVRIVDAGDDYSQLPSLLPPATLLHLGRGEEEKDFEMHCALISAQNARGQRYLYASSFNAVDATLDRAHQENDPPGAQSPYGKFKARCEEELARSCRRWLAFRFSSTHGWAPNRDARTQTFLAKLQQGQEVPVHRGVVQNRTFVGELAAQIAMLALDTRAGGVVHLGASGASEELDFLRALATAFGYPESLVREEGRLDCNAHLVLGKLLQLFPGYRAPSEAEMIARVAAQPELKGYRKNASP